MSNREAGHGKRLSVAMIVRDAEATVAHSLASISAIADEIVVADTGSADSTLNVVAPLATKLIELPWLDDFSAARNTCLQATSGEWILWLDAGETLSEEAAGELRAFVDEQAESETAYRLLVQLPGARGGFAGLQIAQHRLMPQHGGLRFQGAVRESIDDAVANCRLGSETVDLVIQRPDSDHLLDVRLQKARRNLRISERELMRLSNDARLLLTHAEALAELGEPVEARQYFQRARQHAENGSNEMLESYYGELASYDGDVLHNELQLNLCIEALEAYPGDMQLLCAMGSYLQAQQRIDLAARAFQTAVEYGQINHNVWHLADIADIATTCLSIVMELQDRDDEARVVLENALTVRPGSPRIRHQIIDLHVRHGRRTEAIEQVARLPANWPNRESFANAVRGACLGNQQNWASAEVYLETAYEAGCRNVLCLRWLSLAYATLEKFSQAQAILDQWREIEPDNQEIDKIRAKIRVRKFDPFTHDPEGPPLAAEIRQFHVHEAGDGQAPRPKSATMRPHIPFRDTHRAS